MNRLAFPTRFWTTTRRPMTNVQISLWHFLQPKGIVQQYSAVVPADSLARRWAWRPDAAAGTHWQKQQVSVFGQQVLERLQTPPAAQQPLQEHSQGSMWRKCWTCLSTKTNQSCLHLQAVTALWGTVSMSWVPPTSGWAAAWATSPAALLSPLSSGADEGRDASTSTSSTRIVSWPDITMTCTVQTDTGSVHLNTKWIIYQMNHIYIRLWVLLLRRKGAENQSTKCS